MLFYERVHPNIPPPIQHSEGQLSEEDNKTNSESENKEQPPKPKMCVANCGFFGLSKTKDMCSQCFRKRFPAEYDQMIEEERATKSNKESLNRKEANYASQKRFAEALQRGLGSPMGSLSSQTRPHSRSVTDLPSTSSTLLYSADGHHSSNSNGNSHANSTSPQHTPNDNFKDSNSSNTSSNASPSSLSLAQMLSDLRSGRGIADSLLQRSRSHSAGFNASSSLSDPPASTDSSDNNGVNQRPEGSSGGTVSPDNSPSSPPSTPPPLVPVTPTTPGPASSNGSTVRKPKKKPSAPVAPVPVVKVKRNEACTCGSGQKYKKCCGA